MVARALDLALDAADLKQKIKRDAVIVARGRRSRTSVSQGNDYLFIERLREKFIALRNSLIRWAARACRPREPAIHLIGR
jgi:hypothetical protein